MSSSELSSSSICWISSLRFRSLSSSSDSTSGTLIAVGLFGSRVAGTSGFVIFKSPEALFQAPSFALHSLAFLLKPHCEAAADKDQLTLSLFHCNAPILCRSSLCVPRYRTIRSSAVLPGSIGWSTATAWYAFQPLFARETPFLPKFPSLGLQLRDVSLQAVVGWKPD